MKTVEDGAVITTLGKNRQYRVSTLLSKRTFGPVISVVHKQSNINYAIKVVDDDDVENEINILKTIRRKNDGNHNIVKCIDIHNIVKCIDIHNIVKCIDIHNIVKCIDAKHMVFELLSVTLNDYLHQHTPTHMPLHKICSVLSQKLRQSETIDPISRKLIQSNSWNCSNSFSNGNQRIDSHQKNAMDHDFFKMMHLTSNEEYLNAAKNEMNGHKRDKEKECEQFGVENMYSDSFRFVTTRRAQRGKSRSMFSVMPDSSASFESNASMPFPPCIPENEQLSMWIVSIKDSLEKHEVFSHEVAFAGNEKFIELVATLGQWLKRDLWLATTWVDLHTELKGVGSTARISKEVAEKKKGLEDRLENLLDQYTKVTRRVEQLNLEINIHH